MVPLPDRFAQSNRQASVKLLQELRMDSVCESVTTRDPQPQIVGSYLSLV